MTSIASGVLALALAAAALPALSQGTVVAPSPSSRATIDLYEQPGAEQPSRQVPVAELGLPLAFSKTEASHHQIVVGAQNYWVRASQVQIRRAPPGGCVVARNSAPARTGQTPGAGEGC
jgi:hypothetical protein